MADENRTVRVILKFEVNERVLRGIISGTDKVTRGLEGNEKAADKAARAYDRLGNSIDRTAKKARGLSLDRAESLLSRGGAALSGLGLGSAGGAVSGAADAIQIILSGGEALASLGPAATAATGGVGALVASLGPLLVVAAPLAVGIALLSQHMQELNKQAEEAAKGTKAEIKARQDTLDLILSGNLKKAQEELDAAILKQANAQTRLAENQKILREEEEKASKKFLSQFFDQMQGADQQFEELRARREAKDFVEGDPQFADAHNAITQAKQDILDAVESIDQLRSVVNGYNYQLFRNIEATQAAEAAEKKRADALKAATEAAERSAAFSASEAKKREEGVAISKKYDADLLSIETKTGEQRKAIQQKYSAAVAAAIENALDANAEAMARLKAQEDELRRGSTREEDREARRQALEDVQLQIKHRRQEETDLREHLRRVREIQARGKSEERDALLDRNFLALFQLQENKKDELAAEDRAEQDKAQDRQRALEEEKADLAAQRAFEAQERRINLQQQLDDLQRGYQAELQQNAAAKQKALDLAAKSAQAELDLLRDKAKAERDLLEATTKEELRLLNASAGVRLQIAAAELVRYYELLSRFHMIDDVHLSDARATTGTNATPGTPIIRRLAQGGMAEARQPFIYNDRDAMQRETFRGVPLPGGMGVAFPFQSGRVDPGTAGGYSLNQYITVQGASNPEMTAQAVVRISRQQAAQVIKEFSD